MHHSGALVIGAGPERQRVDDGARVVEDVRLNIGDTSRFLAKSDEVPEEDGDVIVGVRTCFAAGAEQDDAFDPLAIGSIERRLQPGRMGSSRLAMSSVSIENP